MGNPTKLVPDNQLILDAPLLKVPLELIRRNFKSAQRNIDKETKAITASLNEAAQKAQLGRASPEETIASVDSMVKRMQTLKRKVCSSPSVLATHRHSSRTCKQRKSCGFIAQKFGSPIHRVSLSAIRLRT